MPAADVLLEADGLVRRFGNRTAVDGVTFAGARGEIVGLLGPNGAGKTTTLRMLAGILPPSAGLVRLAGRDLATEPASWRRPLAYLPEHVAPYEEMSVRAYLRFFARVWGIRGQAARDAADAAAEAMDLTDVTRQVIGTLSFGYRQRVAIAALLAHDPEVLLLDEPTTGLDPRQVVDLRELLERLARDRLVVLSTHRLSEASQLCDRVLVIGRGRQVALGRPAELAETAGVRRVRLVVVAPASALREVLDGLGVTIVALDDRDGTVEAIVESDRDRRADLARAVVEHRWDLLELTDAMGDLEDVFLQLTA